MAESISLHFLKATWADLHRVLDPLAVWIEEFQQWNYPDAANPSVSLYEYDNLLEEYEDEDLDRLFAAMGDWHSSILCIELRRSQENRACDDAERLTLLLLEQFVGAADDSYSAVWTRQEIAEGVCKQDGKFLDCYRV